MPIKKTLVGQQVPIKIKIKDDQGNQLFREFQNVSQKVPVNIWTNDIDDNTIQQLLNVSTLPFIHHHIAAMPDAHLGKGATVGSVIATKKAIIPAAVGVDLGCGMVAVRLSLNANDIDEKILKNIFNQITRDIPVGKGQHKSKDILAKSVAPFENGIANILNKHPKLTQLSSNFDKWRNQMGTLGGGNHFIEVCLDENNQLWLMLHSGSRGVGNHIASYFIELAQQDMQRNNIHLPDKDLAYLQEGSIYFDDYFEAITWAQEYAMENRQAMLNLTLNALKRYLPDFTITSEVVNCHHNYVAKEFHYGEEVYITRKGAIKADKNDLGIIPGSMGNKSYIVKGKGNPESFNSSAHGAGRKMSRTAAKKTFTIDDMKSQTEGIICRKDVGVIDEIPAAYKNIDEVMENQNDLTETLHTLKQILCIKG